MKKWNKAEVIRHLQELKSPFEELGQNGKKPMLQGLADRIKQLAGMKREVKLR